MQALAAAAAPPAAQPEAVVHDPVDPPFTLFEDDLPDALWDTWRPWEERAKLLEAPVPRAPVGNGGVKAKSRGGKGAKRLERRPRPAAAKAAKNASAPGHGRGVGHHAKLSGVGPAARADAASDRSVESGAAATPTSASASASTPTHRPVPGPFFAHALRVYQQERAQRAPAGDPLDKPRADAWTRWRASPNLWPEPTAVLELPCSPWGLAAVGLASLAALCFVASRRARRRARRLFSV